MPIKTRSFPSTLQVNTRVCRFLGGVLRGRNGLATIKSRNKFTPSFSDTKRIFTYLRHTIRRTKCGINDSITFTVSTTTSRLCDRRSKVCRFPKRTRARTRISIGLQHPSARKNTCASRTRIGARRVARGGRILHDTRRVVSLCRRLAARCPLVSVRSNLSRSS